MAFYLANIDKVILVPIDKINGQKSITVRQKKPRNNQLKKVHFIEEFLIDKILCVETLHDESTDTNLGLRESPDYNKKLM